jgi:transposase
MVDYFGGATALWVPDQLRSAVTRPCRYEPDVNRTYEDLAAHYGAVVVPARPRKPRDKSMVSRYLPPGLSRGVGRHDGFRYAS